MDSGSKNRCFAFGSFMLQIGGKQMAGWSLRLEQPWLSLNGPHLRWFRLYLANMGLQCMCK